MDIRQYLSLLRRQRWLVLATVLVVTLSTVVFYETRAEQYRATAIVLVRGEDPTERFFTPQGVAPTAPNVESEAAFVRSFGVAGAAAAAIPGSDPAELIRQVSVSAERESGLIHIHATDHDPDRARDIASAFARAFVDNRRQAAAERRQRVADELGAKLAELQVRISTLDAQIGDAAAPPPPGSPAVVAGPPGSPQAERYAAALQYQQIFERQQLLLIEQSLDQGGAELAAEAARPKHAVGPGIVQGCLVAAFVGLLLAIGLALLREYLDDRFRSRDEIEGEGVLPVLAEIPGDRAFRRGLHGLGAADQPPGPTAEAVRGLRTRLQNLRPDEPVRTLVVTSPHPRDGKSFVAASVATVYAQAGYRTVLVSSDLRRPTLDAVFGPASAGGGLTALLQAPELRPAPSPADLEARRQSRRRTAPVVADPPPSASPHRNGSSDGAVVQGTPVRAGWQRMAAERILRRLGAEAGPPARAPEPGGRASGRSPRPPERSDRPHPAAARNHVAGSTAAGAGAAGAGAAEASEAAGAGAAEAAGVRAMPYDDQSAEAEAQAAAVEGALVATEVANLMFLPSGPPPANPAELLSSAAMRDVLEALRRTADVVIMDTPPVLAVTDATALAALADGVLIVTALGQTHRGALKQAMALLDAPNIRVLGTVLNKVSANRAYTTYYSYAAADTGERGADDAPSNGTGAQAGTTAARP